MTTFHVTTAVAQGPRDHQQDRVHATAEAVFVCDGMGGHRDGGAAAEAAIAVLSGSTPSGPEELHALVVEAGRAVRALGDGGPREPGTTVAGAVLADDDLYITWCGDSRVYVVRDGAVGFVTTDHAGWLGGITRALGAGMDAEPEVVRLDVRPGDVVVACSDGVMAALGDRPDEAVLAASDADALMAACEAAGLGDNTAIVVARVEA